MKQDGEILEIVVPAVDHRPGRWLQYDFGDRPRIDGVKTVLFVAGWRIEVPNRDPERVRGLGPVCFRNLGRAPTYVLTDNEKTVTTVHVAGAPGGTSRRWTPPGNTGFV